MKSSAYRILGHRIRQVREDAGLSQEYVGKQLNITQTGYSYYERGEREMSLDTLDKLAGILGKPVEHFLGLDSPLDEDEAELLHIYERLPNAMKRLLLINARSYLEEVHRLTD